MALGDDERTGMLVALARRANATMRRFEEDQASIARRILLRLVSFGEGRADTRRQQSRTQLRSVGDDETAFSFVLQTLVEDRLLTVDEDATAEPMVDLSHEAIITAWQEFGKWLRERRANEQLRRQLEVKCREWVARGCGATSLLDAIELAEAEKWRTSADAHELGEPSELGALVTASRRTIDERARQHRRRIRRTISGLAAGLVVVSVLGVVAWIQRAETKRQTREVQRRLADLYEEQGRALLIDQSPPQPLRALPYLVGARERREQLGDRSGTSLAMLFARASGATPVVRLPHQREIHAAAFSPDGSHVVTASWDHTARVWDAQTGKPSSEPLAHQDVVNTALFSPDGTRVVTASADNTAQVWDARTGKRVTVPFVHHGIVTMATFSPDGRRVATASADNTARVWDVRTGAPLTEPLAHRGVVYSTNFSPDGHSIVTASADHTARVWDSRTGKPLTAPLEHYDSVYAASFSSDCARIATGSADKTARVWDSRTGNPLTEPLVHGDVVSATAFSPDGARVVTASWDRTARVWDARTGRPLTEALFHQGEVLAAAFSADGAWVVTASGDHTARVWNASTGAV